MANLNNLESPAPLSTTNTQIIGAGYTLPSGFNDLRQPGELSVLYAQNSDAIYNKYKLETDSTNPLIKFGPKQPFFSFTPNTGTKGLNSLKKYENRAAPVGSGPQDILRITKFTISANGVIFATAQTLLQGFNPFPETKIYNPAMPILAATSIASLGLIERPTRFIEPNGIGALAALGVKGSLKNLTPPKGTVGAGALPNIAGDGGKGLIRGSTASQANKNFQSKWQGNNKKGFSFGLSAIGDFFKANTLFGAFSAVKQPLKETYNVSEGSYGTMLGSRGKFEYYGSNGTAYKWGTEFYQRWDAGANSGNAKELIKKNGETSAPDSDKKIFIFNKKVPFTSTYFGVPIGYDPKDVNRYRKYGDNVGIIPLRKDGNQSVYTNSDILSIYKVYLDTDVESGTSTKQSTKFTDKNSDAVKNIEDNLKQVIDNIKQSGYNYNPLSDYDLINPQFSNPSFIGMDYVSQLTKDPDSQKQKVNPFNYNNGGYLTKFKFEKRKQLLDDIAGKGFSGAKYSDKINLLTILNQEDLGLDKKYNGNNDDIIKFYFHDVVNNKYIPFRATITGLNENYNADWTAIEYIGRADKLQSYKGFSRTISFKFNVVANTIKELLPMWQRISYLVGLTKPANYTQGGQSNSNVYSRFMIPPLVRFTIGDIYKNQPGVIKSIGLNIPDNCVWETVSEETSATFDWTYLNGRIQWADSIGKVAQFPRECELNLSMDLLEKERPVVGGTNFGDYYVETRMGPPVQMSGMTNQNEILEEKGTVDSFSKNLYMNFPGGITLSTQRDIDKARNDQLRLQEISGEQIARLEEEIALNKTADEIRSAAEEYNYQLKMEQEQQAANQQNIFETYNQLNNSQPTQDRQTEEYEMDRTGL